MNDNKYFDDLTQYKKGTYKMNEALICDNNLFGKLIYNRPTKYSDEAIKNSAISIAPDIKRDLDIPYETEEIIDFLIFEKPYWGNPFKLLNLICDEFNVDEIVVTSVSLEIVENLGYELAREHIKEVKRWVERDGIKPTVVIGQEVTFNLLGKPTSGTISEIYHETAEYCVSITGYHPKAQDGGYNTVASVIPFENVFVKKE